MDKTNVYQDGSEPRDESIDFNIRLLAEAQSVAHIGIWQWKTGESVKWSEELYKIFGVTSEEYQPSYQGYLEKVHPDDRKRVGEVLASSISNRTTFSQDEKILRGDGSIRHLHTWGHPILDDSGNLKRFIGVCQDITERVRAEEQVRSNEERFRNIVDSAQDGIWLLNENGITLFLNERMAEILEFSSGEFSNRSFIDFVDMNNRDLAAQCLLPAKRVQIKFPLRKKDGSRVWTTIASSPLHDDKGEIVGSLLIVTDQTRSIQHEVLLMAQRDMFEILNSGGNIHRALMVLVHSIETILEDVIGSVVLLDDEGRHILSCVAPGLPDGYNSKIQGECIGLNAGSCGTAAYTRKMVIVENIQTDPRWTKYKALAQNHNLHACWSNPIIDHSGKVLGTFAMYFRKCRRPTENEIAVVLEATGAAELAITHCRIRESVVLVEQRKTESLAKEQALDLSLQKSLQQREDFIFAASHELRTPLTPLAIQTELIKRRVLDMKVGTESRNELIRLAEGAEKQLTKLTKLAEDLLHVTQMSSRNLVLNLESFSLAELVKHVVDELKDDFVSSNCSKVITSALDVIGNWDRQQIERVLYHLISNAQKFGAGRPVEIDISREGEAGLVRITDFGLGIAREDQAHLFRRFYRVASLKKYGGLGIGLFVANEIVKAHGGRIEVESELGKGACFTVRLPAGQNAPSSFNQAPNGIETFRHLVPQGTAQSTGG